MCGRGGGACSGGGWGWVMWVGLDMQIGPSLRRRRVWMFWAGLCAEVDGAECCGQDRVLEASGAGERRRGGELEMGVALRGGCGLDPERSVACPGGWSIFLQLSLGPGATGRWPVCPSCPTSRDPGAPSAPLASLAASSPGTTAAGSVVSSPRPHGLCMTLEMLPPPLMPHCHSGVSRGAQEPLSHELQEQWAPRHEQLPVHLSPRLHGQVLPR